MSGAARERERVRKGQEGERRKVLHYIMSFSICSSAVIFVKYD